MSMPLSNAPHFDWATYTHAVERTAGQGPTDTDPRRLANFGMGLAGEAGEVCDALKKVVFHDHPLDKDKLIEELGDVLWYVAALAATIDVPLEVIARRNAKKLEERYPAGFDPLRSRNRPPTP